MNAIDNTLSFPMIKRSIFNTLAISQLFTLSLVVAEEPTATDKLVASADAVIDKSKTEYVSAAQEAGAIFIAARRLHEEGRLSKAKFYFEKGLALSPWEMDEQLSYGKLLQAMHQNEDAVGVARLVYKTTERQKLLAESAAIAGIELPQAIESIPTHKVAQESFCIVRIGEVEDWIVQKAADMLTQKLGASVYLHPEVIKLPDADRSYYDRWARNLTKGLRWEHPYVTALMSDIGIESKESITVDQTLELLARIAEAQGQDVDRSTFAAIKQDAMDRDKQWNASSMLSLLEHEIPQIDKITFIGITNADLYADDSNYLFGLARTAGKYCLVSYCRFLSAYHQERENQTRFAERLHKQILSSAGFGLGIPRPTDPRSARSYPNGLTEHDLKGTWLSPQCIQGFEKALGYTLPVATRKASPEGMQSL